MMTDVSLRYLDHVLERSRERRPSFFGERKTTRAETAEVVLVAYIPELLAEIRRLRAHVGGRQEP